MTKTLRFVGSLGDQAGQREQWLQFESPDGMAIKYYAYLYVIRDMADRPRRRRIDSGDTVEIELDGNKKIISITKK